MLLAFTVENYRSIREQTTLWMTAHPKLDDDQENLIPFRQEYVLPEVMLLGANGAGKSNILRAILTAIRVLEQSASIQPGEQICWVEPFAFCENSGEKPCTFELVFTVGEIRYVYGFSVTKTTVVEEYLYKYVTEHRSTIFERDYQVFYYPKKKKQFGRYTTTVGQNQLFLALGAQYQDPDCQKPYQYLTRAFFSFNPDSLLRIGRDWTASHAYMDLKEKIIDQMNRADFRITDFKIKPRTFTMKELLKGEGIKTEGLDEDLLRQTRQDDVCYLTHTVFGKPYEKFLLEESSGTINYFYCLAIFLRTLEDGSILIVDKLEDSLHPHLTALLADLFNDPQTNPNHAQLIFATHEATLLSMETLRRDQICFVEKTMDQQNTQLFTLADFQQRKHENRRSNYIIGRYGAIPLILETKI